MKKILYFIATAAIILTSCSKEKDFNKETVKQEAKYSIYAELPTKTTYTVGDAGFAWAADEPISVGTASGYQTFTCADVNTGCFVGSVEPVGIAVTPVQSATFTSATDYEVIFPAEYSSYVPGVTNALMIGAPQAGGNYFFYNAGALIQVTYNNVPATVSKLVVTTGNNITGTASLTTAPSSETPIGIATGDLTDAGKTVTIILAETPADGSSLSFFVPVPTGDLGSLAIELQDSEGTRIDGSNKSLTGGSLTVARGEVLALPAIRLVSSAIIGKEDNSTTWWSAFSPDFTIAKGKRLHLSFTNSTANYWYTSTEDHWQTWYNWVLVLTNGVKRNDTEHGYKEYLAMRADKWGWNSYNAGVDYFIRKSSSSFDTSETFRNEMDGAVIDMTIDFLGDTIFILATYTTTTNVVYTRHLYITGFGSIDSVTAFLTCEKSHLVLTNAYYDDARGNMRPSSLEITGLPDNVVQNIKTAKLVEDGNEIEAKVSWPDGTKTYVDYNDISLSGHETAGEGVTLTATFGKKIFGNNVEGAAYNKTVKKTVTVEQDYIESIEAKVNATVYGASNLVALSNESFEVLANWKKSGNVTRLPSTEYSVSNWTGAFWGTTYEAAPKNSIATITYEGMSYESSKPSCTADLIVSKEAISSTTFGDKETIDNESSEQFAVESGKSVTYAITCETDLKANWHVPIVYICNSSKTKMYEIRMDVAEHIISSDTWNTHLGAQNLHENWVYNSAWTAANVSHSKIYFTVDNNNGYAWVTIFFQENESVPAFTFYENYGRLPLGEDNTIYVKPASHYSSVTFIKE